MHFPLNITIWYTYLLSIAAAFQWYMNICFIMWCTYTHTHTYARCNTLFKLDFILVQDLVKHFSRYVFSLRNLLEIVFDLSCFYYLQIVESFVVEPMGLICGWLNGLWVQLSKWHSVTLIHSIVASLFMSNQTRCMCCFVFLACLSFLARCAVILLCSLNVTLILF